MKYARFAVLALLAVSFAAAGLPEGNATVNWKKAEQNYIVGLKSDNTGVQASAASYIRKYNLTGAVEELKELLGKNNADNVKMSAALALVKIGGEDGRKAVENALEKEENEFLAEFYRTILHTADTARK
ncbi:MAG: hypothetical protein HYV29_01880 [Ignavibacteriales bacterium]|nr:hypothetical protein [Ignavibacteriales bacterium]